MNWDALRDRDSGRPRRTEEPKLRSSRRPSPSSRPAGSSFSQTPKNRSLRAREKLGAGSTALPGVIEEELWFGGHDQSVAEDTAARSMAALVGRIVGAKPFPESARRLADLTRKEVVRIEPIIQVLERDPALSARLLRLVNSAGYALRQRCTSVRHAATLVGTDRLHQIATTAAVLDLFDSRGPIAARIIEHSTIVGAFCRYFGAHLALPVDDLFTAGFLHDIGKLMLLETEGEQYVSLLEQYADQTDVIHVVERSLYGFDHAVLAAHVLNAWNIPDPVPKIVAWHHEPTRAYHVSSMMAALVQTVRLADAAVCAMMRGVSQEDFVALAATECASYLDISEPQLASMWEELQTLYRESIEQCRGECAPALDPRSLRPRVPLSVTAGTAEQSRSAELPLQFPCVVCGGPTFGNTCSACGGHMCPDHQVGREDWCAICARDYHHEQSVAPLAMSPRVAVAIGVGTVAVSLAFGYQTGGWPGCLRTGIGTTLLIALAVVLTVIGRRWLLRFRFVRSRPNRTIAEATENDGGVKSLVPPAANVAASDGNAHRDSLSEHLRLSGAVVERVMINDVPSIPAIIAPRPFDGLSGSPLSRAPRALDEGRLEVPRVPDSARNAFDADRLLRQSTSLVTLPAPARSHSSDLHHAVTGDREPDPFVPESERSSVARSQELHHVGAAAPILPSPIEVLNSNGAVREVMPVQAEPIPEALLSTEQAQLNSEADVPAPAPVNSTHPLAALGLRPPRNSMRSNLRDTQPGTGPVAEPAAESATAPEAPVSNDDEQRTTLVGITADEQALDAESPDAKAEPGEEPAAATTPETEAVEAEVVQATPETEAVEAEAVQATAATEAVEVEAVQATAATEAVESAPTAAMGVEAQGTTEAVDAEPLPQLQAADPQRKSAPPLPAEPVTAPAAVGAIANTSLVVKDCDEPAPPVRQPSEHPAAAKPASVFPAADLGDASAQEARRRSSLPPEIGRSNHEPVVPLASMLKSEPPAAPQATTTTTPSTEPSAAPPNVDPEALVQPLAAALGPEIAAKFGPEFQAKVMDLVAQRVAAAVAEQMLQSFGQVSTPIARPKTSRSPIANVPDSDLPAAGPVPPKRPRRRVAKH